MSEVVNVMFTHPVTGEITTVPVSFVHSETGAPLATSITPQTIAAVITEIISVGPTAVEYLKNLGPYCANLPAPWNLPANPVVQQTLTIFPTLLPILKNLENILVPPSPTVG